MLYSTAPSGHSRTTSLVSVMSCLSPSLIPGKCVSGTQMNLSISGLKASLFLYPLWLYFKRSSFQYWRKYMIVVNSCFEQHTDGHHLIFHHWTTYYLFNNWVNYWSSYILLPSISLAPFPLMYSFSKKENLYDSGILEKIDLIWSIKINNKVEKNWFAQLFSQENQKIQS